MGLRTTLRATEAARRRADREEQRRRRALQARAREAAKLSALEQARLEVETYENRLEVLLSVHKEQGDVWNWPEIRDTPPPAAPRPVTTHQQEIEVRRAAYQPGFFDRLLGRAKRQLARFDADLEAARLADQRLFDDAQAQHQKDLAEWEDDRQLAAAVLRGDRDAYGRVLRELTPFTELSDLGSSLTYRIHSPALVETLLKANAEQAIPSQIKSLTSTGKLTTKAMPKARFHEIYQDHVCGAVLRVGREVLALLPVDTVLVTALTDLFDSRTGRTTEQPILSVALTRSVMERLNFDRLDPSDAMENFTHRGDFKASRRSGAFVPITPLTPADLLPSPAPLPRPAQPQPPTPAPAPASSRTAPAPLPAPTTATPTVNPFPARWADALRRNEIQHGFLRLNARELAELLGQPPRQTFSLAESRALARAVESFGYAIEPDPRFGSGAYAGDREVGLFQPPSGTFTPPSEAYLGASALLQLSLAVAASDGSLDRSELDPFRQFIEAQFPFTPDEHQRLVVLESLLSRHPAHARLTLGRAARLIPPGKQILVARFLVEVAAADGSVSPRERQALARVFEALDLDLASLDALLQSLPSTTSATPAPALPSSPSPAPPGPSPSNPPSLRLDMSRVAAISAETREVISLLARAMAHDASEDSPAPAPVPTVPATTPPVPIPAAPASLPSPRLASLDSRYHPALLRLLERDAWPRPDFEELAREHRLFPMGLMDAVNQWSDSEFGDFLLHGDDPITVHRSLLPS